jgi:hypothetical protein
VSDRFEDQLRSAFPAGAITRVQVVEYGDDPEVEPGKTALRAFFDWPGRTEGKKADPKTVHAFVHGNGATISTSPANRFPQSLAQPTVGDCRAHRLGSRPFTGRRSGPWA